MAAGKSTVARLLASRFERGVHLEGDFFRRSVVSGRAEMTPEPTLSGGWGLHLVDRVALNWGVHEGSTHVWFEVGPQRRRHDA